MAEVTVAMPLQLTPEMMRAVRDHPFTKCATADEFHAKLGWLICAWDVLIEARKQERAPNGDKEADQP